jgi:Family of unknown function (DUF6535)
MASYRLTIILQNSLFSSIVASFIIEIYKILLPVNGQQTTSGPSSIAIRINIVLFLSFFLSIMSALSCALIQQWCSEYLKYAHPRAAPHDCGRVRTFLFQGLRIFQMRRFMYGTHVLLHISVFLFFWALSDFFYTVEHHFGLVARYALVVSGMVYILFSILPLIFSSCPFNTPMTPPLRAGCIIFLIIVRSPLWCLQWYRRQDLDLTGLPYYKGIHFDRTLLYSIKAEERAARLEFDAMEWLFTDDDFSDEDMDKFLEGLPGYMSSRHTKRDRLDQYLTAEHILSRIKEHFITCVTSVELSDDASCDRVSSCVKALLRIFQYSHEYKEASKPDELDEELLSQRTYIQTLMDEFQRLCDMPDQMIALRASCIRALAVQGLLSQLVPPDTRTTDRPRFPVSLIPIYTYFFPNDNVDTIQLLDGNHMSSAAEIEGMWKNLLHDGPIANLTKLGQAVLKKERALPSSLPFCWKALDTLLPQIRTIHSEELPRAQIHFDILHEDTRTYVHTDERGFRIRPLLDRLDTISRGRRLLMLFSSHPTYRNMVDAFEDEDLRNGDLLEAFAHCLPVFISNSSTEVCRDFMEKVIRHDDLWDSLQANLWNAQWSDSPTPDKLRVFEDCCTVLDLAFSVLGDLQDVDWRAHEFGSLLQHFESFITHCFQGSSMERTTSFRVGIIKARFCKILLAQLSNELDREGTVSIRSQWDVASLARLIYTLGLWGKEDAEFWDSYVNGGHIGPDFTTKALEMIDITARDGPLLIFCQLGHLTATAVPLDQSGPERMDIEKLWELQKKLIEDKRLPLDRASDTVWKRLGQLREQVNKLTGKITGKDRVFLQRLLRIIDGVSNSRFSRSEGPTQSEPAEEKGPETSVAVNSTPYSGGSRASFASESTAVTGRLSSGSQTSEGEDSFGRASSLLYYFLELLLTCNQSVLWTEFYIARRRPMYGLSLLEVSSRAPTAPHLGAPWSQVPPVSE